MTQRPRGKAGLIVLLLALALVIAGADQITKYLAEEHLTPGVVIPLVGQYLGLQLIYNPGAAFSLATGMTWVLTVIMVVVIVVILRVARRLRSTAWAFALGALLGGAVGNLYDRLLRDPGFGRGHVVDFINYNGWFVGNVADIAIVLAAVLIAILALRGIEVDGTRAADDDDEPQPVAASPEDYLEEEPIAGGDFSPEVPQASGETVDVASWAAGAPSVSTARHQPVDVAGGVPPGEPATARQGPASSGPGAVEPEPAEPAPQPEPEPIEAEPAPTEPAPAESAPAEPAPAEPAPTEPDPMARPAASPSPSKSPGTGTTWRSRQEALQRRPTRREIRLAQQDDDG